MKVNGVHRPVRCGVVLLLAFLTAAARPACAATGDDIDRAVKRGVEFIYSKQNQAGGWEKDAQRVGTAGNWQGMQGSTFGGFTALSLYALLSAGENPGDPRIAKGVEFLKNADIVGIYALGMRCNVWALLPQTKETRAAARKDKDLLLNALTQKGVARGFWDYSLKPSGRLDHSVSHWGVSGLWACERTGLADVELRYWKTLDQVWRAHQYPDGGWSYEGDGKDERVRTASMTASGMDTLLICLATARGDEEAGTRGVLDAQIEAGLGWLDLHAEDYLTTPDAYVSAVLASAASGCGRKYFGKTDWWTALSGFYVAHQGANGSWGASFAGATPLTATSFVVIAFAQGRATIVMNKLVYGPRTVKDGPLWNERPRDVANLVDYFCRQRMQSANWHTVDLRVHPDDLADAPALWVSGSRDIALTAPESDAMKAFVDRGGLIVGNADGARDAFNASFKHMAAAMFPQLDFHDLPPTHPLFECKALGGGPLKSRPKVQVLGDFGRPKMLLIPDADIGRAWQARAERQKDDLFRLGAEILLWARSNRGL